LQRRNTREGWWEPLGGEVEKRAPTIDKSTKAKGEKTNTYPTSVNPAVLEMFKRFFEICIAEESVCLGDFSPCTHHTGFLAHLEGGCHQLEGSVNATNILLSWTRSFIRFSELNVLIIRYDKMVSHMMPHVH
jgi:hypothetical protein